MEDRQLPTPLQRRVGILVIVMAGAVAITPLAAAWALRNSTDPLVGNVMFAASLFWLISVAIHRGLSRAHERWRRKVLRQEIAAARRARLKSSESFQDRLNEQRAILERIAELSQSILDQGITDPAMTLSTVRIVNSHAHESLGLVDDALAETRVETGSIEFDFEELDLRDEIEVVIAPLMRAGHSIATGGPRYHAVTDAAVFRLIIRSFVTRALDGDANHVDVSLARDHDRIVCTVADDGPDRSRVGLVGISPIAKSLSIAVQAELSWNYALGWNQVSVSLPAADISVPVSQAGDPLDVLGNAPSTPAPRAPVAPPGPVVGEDELITFLEIHERDRTQSVTSQRKAELAGK